MRSIVPFGLLLFTGGISAQCTLVCKNNVNAYVNETGVAKLTPELLLQSYAGCTGSFIIEATDSLGNRYGADLPANTVGKKFTANVAHSADGNSCSSIVQVLDNLPPVITCQDTLFIWCNQAFTPAALGVPVVTDNVTGSGSISLTNKDVFSDMACMSMVGTVPVTAKVTRTWTATDSYSNTTTRVQHIFLKRATLDMVVFPKHKDGVQSPALECSVDNAANLNLTGQPMVENTPLDNTTHCDLITSSTDQNIPICGGARRIIRTWTVFDLCTNDFRVFSQIILQNDTKKPVLTCPASFKVAASNTSCSAAVTLPQATATDACSGATVSASWSFGTGYGPFNGVTKGVHKVTYTAVDGCNNSTSCEITVTVQDESNPTAICQSQVAVSLQNDGKARVYANSYNNGSHDNCGIDYFRVSRDNGPFVEFINLDCSDLNKSVSIKLKVVDLTGLESLCASTTIVKDDIKPTLTCPPTINFSCGANYNNPTQTGIPTAVDNCSVQSTNYTNSVNLNSCGIGTVVRTWIATDGSGNTSSCQQTINITDNTSITIDFPKDILSYQCGTNLDTAVTGSPKVIGRDCEQLQITSTDYFFYTAQPACFKLLRKWAVINWCVYQPNDPSGAGFWEHTQVIEVRDTIAPILTCPSNVSVEIQNTQCQAFVDVPLPQVNDCSKQVTFTNVSAFASSGIGKASGNYPIGTHNVTYLAADGCGNTAICKTMVIVKDGQAPTPVCNNGVSVTILQNGSVTLTPAMINGGSSDNCTVASRLVLQVSPNTFTCQSLGNKTVTLTVTDETGNSAFCNTTVIVQDNFRVCGTQTTMIIAGKLAREGGDPASQKPVGLSGGLSIAVHTGVDGTFAFPNLPLGQTYTLTPSYNTKPSNGVTTLDIVIIRRHILGVEQLGSPYSVIAADVNKSGGVTTLDLVDLQKLILNITTSFPNNTPSWRFVDASYVFPNQKNPFAHTFPESITMTNVMANQWNKNFVAIKVGDVNTSAIPTSFDEDRGDDRSFDGMLQFIAEEQMLKAGQEYLVPLRAKDFSNIAGLQFTIDFDQTALQFVGIEKGGISSLSETNFGTQRAKEGELTFSWDNITAQKLAVGETFFSLKFVALKSGKLSDLMALNSSITPAEAYAGDLYAPQVSFKTLGISLAFEPISKEGFQAFQNTPNPFHENTRIGFYVPEATTVKLKVYDVYGRLLKTSSGKYSRGTHEIEIDMSGRQASGLLFAEIEAEGFQRQTIRMMMAAR